MSLSSLVQDVQVAAEAVSSGDPNGHVRLLRAIQDLNLAAETPTETLIRISLQPVQSAAVRLAVEMDLPKILIAGDGRPLKAQELAVKSGASRLLIVRVMRVLCALKLCDEVGEEDYLANAVTKTLASPTFTGGTRYVYDTLVPVLGKLTHYMHDTNFANPEGRSPFEYTFNVKMWEYISQNPVLQVGMMDYMEGRRKGAVRWLDFFPIESLLKKASLTKEDVLFVDIGGNQGHDLKLLKERHPNIPGRLILQDLPKVIDGLKGPLEGIEAMPYDFFTPQPIKGARIYFFRAVLHDWSDDECRRFLTNTVHAMDKDHSTLLINEFVLPNTGAGLHPALLDLTMMSLSSGIERTERHWHELLDSVGLDIVKIWPGTESVIEAKRRHRA